MSLVFREFIPLLLPEFDHIFVKSMLQVRERYEFFRDIVSLGIISSRICCWIASNANVARDPDKCNLLASHCIFYACAFFDLVKCSVVTFVGKIQRYRNDHYCHHHYLKQVHPVLLCASHFNQHMDCILYMNRHGHTALLNFVITVVKQWHL